MKHKIWTLHLLSAFFSFALSVSAVGCLTTGFNLKVTSTGSLILCCFTLSLLFALILWSKHGGSLLLCLSALAAILLWRHSTFPEQFQALLLHISTLFHRAYNWPVLGSNTAEFTDLPLMAIAWWTSASVSFCICRSKHIVLALPSVILPAAICMVVTDTVPDEIYLYLLILGAALLLMTDWVRRKHPEQCISLTMRVFLPVAAALAALFILNPQDGYINHAGALQKEVLNWFQQLQLPNAEIAVGTDAAVSQQLNLRNVGPKSTLSYSVMRINSPISGTLYLRGQDYDTYSGEGWTATRNRSETFTSGKAAAGQLTITTYGVRNVLYIPYYATGTTELNGGCAENSENIQTYQFYLSREASGNTAVFDSAYTNLPYDTYQWARPLAESIVSGSLSEADKVQAIGNYVRNSASYDLSTSRMSAEYDDFAQWFLQESETGYCVHFATAATVLLRSAGIPARYVEGYMVTCTAGENLFVSSQSAHAWAEYFDSDTRTWSVLEATPADPNAAEQAQEETSRPTTPANPDPIETHPESSQPTEDIETHPSIASAATDASQPQQQEFSFTLPRWAKALLWLIPLATAVILQEKLRILHKRRRWKRGSPNAMALERWRQSEQLARFLSIPVPEELEYLAQKAKFSQYTLTQEELLQFDLFRRNALRLLNEQPSYKKWFLRCIWAVG